MAHVEPGDAQGEDREMSRREAEQFDQWWSVAPNPCPRCGSQMQGGAPHGPWSMQYECPRCGYIEVPSGS